MYFLNWIVLHQETLVLIRFITFTCQFNLPSPVILDEFFEFPFSIALYITKVSALYIRDGSGWQFFGSGRVGFVSFRVGPGRAERFQFRAQVGLVIFDFGLTSGWIFFSKLLQKLTKNDKNFFSEIYLKFSRFRAKLGLEFFAFGLSSGWAIFGSGRVGLLMNFFSARFRVGSGCSPPHHYKF